MNIIIHIEISKNSNIKYEYDHKTNELICDRILHTTFSYPFNYGYIPKTLSDDGDPLDAVVICDFNLVPNSYILCKVVGVLETKDENGKDDKIILVPADKVDLRSKNINNINNINDITKDRIKHFFKHYKDLEKDKWIKVGNYMNKEKAINVINESIKKYKTSTL